MAREWPYAIRMDKSAIWVFAPVLKWFAHVFTTHVCVFGVTPSLMIYHHSNCERSAEFIFTSHLSIEATSIDTDTDTHIHYVYVQIVCQTLINSQPLMATFTVKSSQLLGTFDHMNIQCSQCPQLAIGTKGRLWVVVDEFLFCFVSFKSTGKGCIHACICVTLLCKCRLIECDSQ